MGKGIDAKMSYRYNATYKDRHGAEKQTAMYHNVRDFLKRLERVEKEGGRVLYAYRGRAVRNAPLFRLPYPQNPHLPRE